jgi:2,3-bisphosphoglycerate-independent phosphoglycerate mutase
LKKINFVRLNIFVRLKILKYLNDIVAMKNIRTRPLTLLILDGWGHRDESDANAIAAAHKPNWDKLLAHHPHALISGSGPCVGLPQGQMGNSEVGHLNMGAGRIVYQDLTRIDLAIENGDFFKNEILVKAIKLAQQTNKSIHVLGLLSPGGVHSHEKHLHALIELTAKLQAQSVYIHAFLDGRDTPPRSARASLESLDQHCQRLQCGQIASIIGRYYAMDRDKRWDRIQKAYDLCVLGKAQYTAANAVQGLELAYSRGETDEFVLPTKILSPGYSAGSHSSSSSSSSSNTQSCPSSDSPLSPPSTATINDGDVVIFMNFRADRAREITQSLIDPHFQGFKREKFPHLGEFVCLSEYDTSFQTPLAFPPLPLPNILAECLSQLGLKQLRMAETEKYAHVTFFFNGGVEQPYPNEDRLLIPSPKVATYDLQPEMSAPELTENLVQAIKSQHYDFIVCNYANADMVGHTGNFAATVKAIEAIDACLGKITQALEESGGELIVTADHGNAEKMFDPRHNQAHTAHTSEPVPFLYLGRPAKIINENGKLSDLAPTILYLLGLPQPPEMTGSSLLTLV